MTSQTIADFAAIETLAIALYESGVRHAGYRGQSVETMVFIQVKHAEWRDMTPEDRQSWRIEAHKMVREAKDHA